MKYGKIEHLKNQNQHEYLDIISPLNEEVIAQCQVNDTQDLDVIVNKAKIAQKSWARLTMKKRSQIFYKYRELLEVHRQELAEICHYENGKTMAEAHAGVDKAIELVEFACSLPNQFLDKVEVVSTGVECKMSTRPLGVVASITPFNFPIMVPHWTFPIALMMGNAVVVKPSEKAPLSAIKCAEYLKEAGLPDGLFNVFIGAVDAVNAVCDHPDIKAVSFVGSTKVAKIVYQRVTSQFKRCLAMGGAKNYLLVNEDAHIANSARDIVASATGMAGQRCMAASVFVEIGNTQPIIDEVINLVKKQELAKDIPAIISKDSLETIKNYLDYATQQGAKLLVDGREKSLEKGYYIGASIIDWRGLEDKMSQEEIFGPVLEIVHADNLTQAIKIQNDSPYGNGSSIFTENGKIAQEALNHLSAGMLGVNIGVPVPREPFSFGGIKNSKFGVGDITGIGCANFFSDVIKETTKWNTEIKESWMD